MWKHLLTCVSIVIVSLLHATTLTYDFQQEDAKLTSSARWTGESPWVNATTNRCYQRRHGLGLCAPSSAKGTSGITADLHESKLELKVVKAACCISSKTPVNQTLALALTVTFADGYSETQTLQFSFGEEYVSTAETTYPINLVFTLNYDESYVESVTLTNTTENAFIFELSSVALLAEIEPLQATAEIYAYGEDDKGVATVKSIAGGSGTDYTYTWEINGQTFGPYSEIGKSITFDYPDEGGRYTATLHVQDGDENTTSIPYSYIVGELAAPYITEISNITTTSFDVKWENGSIVPPRYYHLRVTQPRTTITQELSPEWTLDGDNAIGRITLSLPITSINEIYTLTLSAEGWTGDVSIAMSEDGETWTNAIPYFESYGYVPIATLLNTFESLQGSFYLRIPKAFASDNITLCAEIEPTYAETIVFANGLKRTATFSNLPIAETVQLHLDAIFTGERHCSLPAETIQLAPLSPFTTIEVGKTNLYPHWPEDNDVAGGCATFYAETATQQTGLYLTRAFHSTGDTSGKGIILTNTTSKAINISTYSLQKRTTSGSTATTTLPACSLPAQSECLLYYPTPKIPLANEITAISSTGSALNFTDGATLTLLKDNTPINTLSITTGNVTRLASDTQTASLTPYDEALTLPTLWSPWTGGPTLRSVELLDTQFLNVGDSMVPYSLEQLQAAAPNATRLYATFVTTAGTAQSTPLEVPLWSAPTTAARGYRLRLQ